MNAVPVGELTVSLFRETYPAELFQALGRLGVKIERHYPGIYYIHGWKAMPAIQIVVTKELRGKTHRALKVLSKHVTEEDARGFVEEASQLTEPGDKDNVDTVMDASVATNKGVYEKIRRDDPFMCEALRELMKDEIESEIAEREQKAALEADQKARQEKSIELIRNLMETMKMTADQAMTAMKISDEDRREYRAKL